MTDPRTARERRDHTFAEIWTVLVDECGAPRDAMMLRQFVDQWPACREFRFQGALGFGGKIWADRIQPRMWVSCYPEDRTPERDAMIDRANQRLDAINVRGLDETEGAP